MQKGTGDTGGLVNWPNASLGPTPWLVNPLLCSINDWMTGETNITAEIPLVPNSNPRL